MVSIRDTLAATVAFTILLAPLGAFASGDLTGTEVFVEDRFAPTFQYTATKTYTVYRHDSPNNPLPLEGHFTYTYSIVNEPSSTLFLQRFEILTDTRDVFFGGVGYIPAGDPNTITVSDPNVPNPSVEWNFDPVINPGEASPTMYIHSTLGPCTVQNNIASVSGQFALDTQADCVGPKACLFVSKQACVEQSPGSGVDDCDGKVVSLTLEYTGLGCADGSSNSQDPSKAICTGDANDTDPLNVLAKAKGKKKKTKKTKKGKKTKKSTDDSIFTKKTKKSTADSIYTMETVPLNGTFQINAADAGLNNLTSSTTILLSDPNGLLEEIVFHTSCSQPLSVGDSFGSVTVIAMTTTEGGKVALPGDEDCIQELPSGAPPHCLGKLEILQVRYTGSICPVSPQNSQPADKQSCSQDMLADPNETVRVLLTDGGTGTYLDVSGVTLGDLLDATAAMAGRSNFSANTEYQVLDDVGDVIQGGNFHTSCSKPLNLGDSFGSLQVTGMQTTEGGTAGSGANVDYTYDLVNVCPNVTVTNIDVVDDKLGILATGETLTGVDILSLVATQFLTEETTNTVTVTFDQDGIECTDCDSETITVGVPPDPSTVCSTRASALLLRYTGMDILGATVEIEPDKSPLVTYVGVDLIEGVTVLSDPGELGFSVNAKPDEVELGAKTKIRIN
ncbi:MAG: hypothetical protein JRG76_06315, partial [Deltaproteobacteria bacterium]|nr:hypothetical protein [Deltaproteobacteria bacterium]